MIVIASPHMDDEVLGCASFLGAGDDPGPVTIIYTTRSHPEFGVQVRAENDELARRTGADMRWPDGRGEEAINDLDRVGQAPLISAFEAILNELRPTTVLVVAPSYNQDHRAVYDAMLTACRPHDRNWFVPRVLAYEEPETHGTLRKPAPFRATYYRYLDVAAKLDLYHVYASQVRAHRSDDHIRAMAAWRGMESGMAAAEAFEVLRWVE